MLLDEWNKTTDLVYPAHCRMFIHMHVGTFHHQTKWLFVQVIQECSTANDCSLVQVFNQVCYVQYIVFPWMSVFDCYISIHVKRNILGWDGLIQCTTWHFVVTAFFQKYGILILFTSYTTYCHPQWFWLPKCR